MELVYQLPIFNQLVIVQHEDEVLCDVFVDIIGNCRDNCGDVQLRLGNAIQNGKGVLAELREPGLQCCNEM